MDQILIDSNMGLVKTGIKGVAWTTVSIVIRSVVSLFQITILTRFLEKADFGIVAIATVFIGFTQIFLDLGISVGIMHKQDTSPQEYSSLFWLNIFVGLLLAVVLAVISPLVAEYYNEPSLSVILSLLSLGILFSSIGSQHRTVQQKLMRFKYISIVEIITSLLTFGLTIYLAMHEFGIFTLVYSTLFNAFFSNFLFLVIGLYKDRNISFHFKFVETYPFLKIGIYKIGSSMLDYFSREIDTIIISKVFGMEILGVYNLCKKIIMMLYSIVNQILVKVMSPIFATLQKDINVMRKGLYDVTESVALFNFLIYFLVAIFATGLLKLLYGSSFVDYGFLLSLLAIYYGYLECGSVSSCVQIAMGRTDVGLYWTIVRIALNTAAVLLGSFISIEVIVLFLFVFNLFISPVSWKILVKPLVGGQFWEYFQIILKPLCYSILIALPFYLVFQQTVNIVLMICGGFLFAIVYSAMVWLLYRDSFFVKSLLAQTVSLFFRRKAIC